MTLFIVLQIADNSRCQTTLLSKKFALFILQISLLLYHTVLRPFELFVDGYKSFFKVSTVVLLIFHMGIKSMYCTKSKQTILLKSIYRITRGDSLLQIAYEILPKTKGFLGIFR